MYGRNGRIGLLLPATNSTVEMEFHRAVPEGVSVHSARCPLRDDGVDRIQAILEMSTEAVAASTRVAAVRPGVLAWACTAGSFLNGLGHDRELIAQMEAATGIPALTTSTAVVDALRCLDVRRVAVTTPYIHEIDVLERRFLEASIDGLQITKMHGLGVLGAYDKGLLSPGTAYDAAKLVDSPEAECIFISCTAWRTFEVIETLERELGKPVVTSNQATLWAVLNALDIEGVSGLGSLLSTRPGRGVGARPDKFSLA